MCYMTGLKTSQACTSIQMFQPQSPFLRDFVARGYMHQCTNLEELDKLAMPGKPPLIAYIGFDATADSLHVGSMVQIMMLRLLQKSGGKPIVLMGGGTTKVGDPTGRDEMRKVLSDADIAQNIAGIKKIFSKFLTFGDGPTDAVMVNNDEWLAKLNYLEFLRDYGRHFSVNRMLAFDSVKLRLERENPLTFLEFNYMILQAYDFLELSRRENCVLQMGGSDQWGNIVNGIELGRRCDQKQLYALTSPLLTTASGAKMGKTMSGAVWLNADLLSPYDYWQYWRNCEDADVGRFLKLYTELPLAEIARLGVLGGSEVNEAKKVLANEATAMLHGAAAAAEAAETARRTFEEGASAEGLPTIGLDLAKGTGLLAACVAAGFASSNGEARRHIQGGAIRINDVQVSDDRMVLNSSHLNADGVIKLSMGKKKHVLVRPA